MDITPDVLLKASFALLTVTILIWECSTSKPEIDEKKINAKRDKYGRY